MHAVNALTPLDLLLLLCIESAACVFDLTFGSCILDPESNERDRNLLLPSLNNLIFIDEILRRLFKLEGPLLSS